MKAKPRGDLEQRVVGCRRKRGLAQAVDWLLLPLLATACGGHPR